MNIRWGHDFINHFIWFIFIRNYVTCYIFVFESQFEHTSAVSTDARRKYKITWSYRYRCESLRCGQEPKSERGEYVALTDEQSVQAILKHPNACRHVTLSDMHSLRTHTKACTRLVDTPRVSQCYYIPHFLILCFLQPWKCHSLRKGLGFPTDLPQGFEFQEGSKNYSLLQSCSIPASVHAGVYRGPIILINTIPLYLAVSHTHLKPLHESVLSSSCNDWILLIKAAKSNVTTFSPYPHEYWWLQVPENSMGQSEGILTEPLFFEFWVSSPQSFYSYWDVLYQVALTVIPFH